MHKHTKATENQGFIELECTNNNKGGEDPFFKFKAS